MKIPLGTELQTKNFSFNNEKYAFVSDTELTIPNTLHPFSITVNASVNLLGAFFVWKDSILPSGEMARIEDILVKFHDVFASQRLNIGMNEEFTAKMTLKDDSPA